MKSQGCGRAAVRSAWRFRSAGLTAIARTVALLLMSGFYAARLGAQPLAATSWSTNEYAVAGFGSNATFRVRTDSSGNVFVATTLVNPAYTNAELALYKYSNTGLLLWKTNYDYLNAHRDHFLAGLEVDQGGNAYLAATAVAGAGGGDWLVQKYDPNGVRVWTTIYGSGSFDNPIGLAVDERGYIAVAGNYATNTIRAVRFNMLSGAISGAVGVSPVIGTDRVATAMTIDGAGDVWVTGASGSNCLTLRFMAQGLGLIYSGKALSPAGLGPAAGRAIAWSPTNNLVFVLAAAQTLPLRQIVLCYSNVSFPTIPLFTGWHSADPIPGTWLKPVIVRPSNPYFEDPVALVIASGGRVATLAQSGTTYGADWVVTGWNPTGSTYVETDSTLGPSGSLPVYYGITAAGLATDPDGNIVVTGTGTNFSVADFATVRFARLGSGFPLARDWFHHYDYLSTTELAGALAVDVAGNILITGSSEKFGNRFLSTVKIAQSPLNDSCFAARQIGEGTVAFSTKLATNTFPPVSGCASDTNDVWFQWTAPATGQTEIDTYGSTFDTVLSVYTGTCGALSPVACNDNAAAGRPVGSAQSFLSFNAQARTNYFIQVGAAGSGGDDGRLTIFGPLLATCPPSNAPSGPWRKFLVLGSGTSSSGGIWRLTVPGCMDVAGLAPTSIGASASALATNLAASIQAACGLLKIRAVAVSNALFFQVKGCPTNEPVFFRTGSLGTPLNQLCLLADAPPPGPLFPVTPPICSYNPTVVARSVASADCNGNGVADEVDIASGVSEDTNNNSIPDECEGGLKISMAGTAGVVFWSGPGYILETSPNPTSTDAWTTYSTESPTFVPFTAPAQFFRLRPAP